MNICNRSKISLLVICQLLLCGCSADVATQLKHLSGKQISFDLPLTQVTDEHKISTYLKNDSILKFVVYCDSTECSACRVSTLARYNDLFYYADISEVEFMPVILFSVSPSQLPELEKSLLYYQFPHPIYIDENNIFSKINPHLPADKRLHSFLLDKNNNVILVGDPTSNHDLWALYKKTINELQNK